MRALHSTAAPPKGYILVPAPKSCIQQSPPLCVNDYLYDASLQSVPIEGRMVTSSAPADAGPALLNPSMDPGNLISVVAS